MYSPNQGMIICDHTYSKPYSCIIVGDDAVVRFWPDLSLPHEYIDQKIPNIHNDSCVLVDKITDDVLVFVFKSMKIIIADLNDYAEAGISFKQFTQPVGFISRCLSSLFVGNYYQNFVRDSHDRLAHSSLCQPFISAKANKNLKEDMELLLLVDNNIDSLCLDILLNGKVSVCRDAFPFVYLYCPSWICFYALLKYIFISIIHCTGLARDTRIWNNRLLPQVLVMVMGFGIYDTYIYVTRCRVLLMSPD